MFNSADLPNVKANTKKDYFVNVEERDKSKIVKEWLLKKHPVSKTKIIIIASVAAVLIIGIIIAVIIMNIPKNQPASAPATQSETSTNTSEDGSSAYEPESVPEDTASTISAHLDEIYADPANENPDATASAYLTDLTDQAKRTSDYDMLYTLAIIQSSFWGSRDLYDDALSPLLDLDPSRYDAEHQYVIYYTIYTIYDVLGDTENSMRYLNLANQIHPVFSSDTDDDHDHNNATTVDDVIIEGTPEEYERNPASNGPTDDRYNSPQESNNE